jgi:hypothetical protein
MNLLSRVKEWFSEDKVLLTEVGRAGLRFLILRLIMILLLVIALVGFWLYYKLFH